MTSKECNLATIGYNLVCAVTQAAINQTMESYVSTLNGTIDSYTVYDFKANEDEVLTAAVFATLCTVNPLTVPNGTTALVDPNGNDDLNILYRAGFKYGIQAVTGIDSSWASTPDIVVLNELGTTVTYNMYFATIQVVELEVNYSRMTFTNCSQPDDSPWIFSYTVNLALDNVTSQPDAPSPQSDLFSVQQLYVDLNKATGNTYPSITTNLSPKSAEFVKDYIDAYVQSIPPGSSVISYAQVQKPEETISSITVTTLQFATIPESNTSPAMLNYLCMSNYKTAPYPIKYPSWSWLGLHDPQSGVMAVQRVDFGNYLVGILNNGFEDLSAQTDAVAKYKDSAGNCSGSFNFSYKCPSNPAVWIYNSNPDDSTGSRLANASYNYSSGNQHTYSSNCSILGSISCTWSYTLFSEIEFYSDANGQPHLVLNISIVSPVHVHFCGGSKNENVVDLTAKVDYALSIAGNGEVRWDATTTFTNNSQTIPQLNTNCGSINFKDCNDMYTAIDDNLKSQLEYYEKNLLNSFQHTLAWYFPGSSSFTFSQLGFSDCGDLTVNIVYDSCAVGDAANPCISNTSEEPC